MLKIRLKEGRRGDAWLAQLISVLLGDYRFHADEAGPPWYDGLSCKWQLTRNNNYWLRWDGEEYVLSARYPANVETIIGFADLLRQLEQIESVTVAPR